MEQPGRATFDERSRDVARAPSDAWGTIAPSAFVLVVLAILVLVPLVNAAYVTPARERIRLFADPARATVTRVHVALALEGALVHDYAEARDSALARRYREAVRQEDAATRELEPLVAQLGDTVRARFLALRGLQTAWHTAAERGLSRGAPAGADDLRKGHEYERLLLAAARLDEAIGDEIRSERARIIAADRTQRWTTVLLALAGLGGAVAVAFLARRVRAYASLLEAQHAALERASEARARLMRGVSHDLKNPLHAIDGHAALLGDGILGPLVPRQQDSVDRIRRGVRSVLLLVEDLLELSRAEAGQLRIDRRPTDLASLLHDAVEEHRASARSAGHEMTLSLADAVPTVVTDPHRVRQVLGNLLSNAVKYTPTCGRIDVRAERRARPGEGRSGRAGAWVAIDVVDTGPGIPAEKLDAIFDEFARLQVHAAMPGAGLGLAIARRVARLLGGDLTAQSDSGGGARFTLWLPVDPSSRSHRPAVHEPTPQATPVHVRD